MPKFEKGHPKYGGRKSFIEAAPKLQRDIRTWTRSLFEDPRYQASIQARLLKGRLPPQVECKLLAYAYGEPPRDVTVNANLRGLVSVVHEHIAKLATEDEPETFDVPALPSPNALEVTETTVQLPQAKPDRIAAGNE